MKQRERLYGLFEIEELPNEKKRYHRISPGVAEDMILDALAWQQLKDQRLMLYPRWASLLELISDNLCH